MPSRLATTSLSAISKRLRITRQVAGLSQTEFAARAGIAKNAYNQYESAKQRPSLDSAIALAKTHKLTLDWIYLGDASGLRYETAEAIAKLLDVRGVN